ncbi:MAG: hypothetical protein RIB64_15350 [Arenibacter algicola]
MKPAAKVDFEKSIVRSTSVYSTSDTATTHYGKVDLSLHPLH